MTGFWILVLVLLVGWIVVNLPRRRSDGELVTGVHPYRRMLGFMMPRRNEAVVYYDEYVSAEAMLEYLERVRPHMNIDIIHLLVGACMVGLRDNPKMNQFVTGKRLYQRNQVAITFSMKRKKLDKEAKLAAVKLAIPDGQTFEELCARINTQIEVERSGSETYSDKELGFMTRLPRPILSFCIKFVQWADYHNLVPASFIKNDGFYTSMFVANLGSLGMTPAYHHLYEYGNCPLFLMVGKIEDRAVVVDGNVVPQATLHLRYSYDERIDDGLTAKHGMASVKRALENPAEWLPLSCLAQQPPPLPGALPGQG